MKHLTPSDVQEFEQEFSPLNTDSAEEISVLFLDNTSKDLLRWFDTLFAKKIEGVRQKVENMVENAKKYPMKKGDTGEEAEDWNYGYRSALREVLSLLNLEEQESGMKCESCGLVKADVTYRPNAYAQEIGHDPTAYHTVCDDCNRENIMDI